MLWGSQKHSVNYDKYVAPKFRPNLWDGSRWETCGSSALSMITGKRAGLIEKHLPAGRQHWTDYSATNYLRANGYTVLPVTKNSFINYRRRNGDWESPIRPDHILLCNLQIDKDASWFVLNRGKLYHNYLEESRDIYTFLLFIPWSIFLVSHPKWK